MAMTPTELALCHNAMERVFGSTEKIIVDQSAGSGIVPYLPLNELTRRPAPSEPSTSGQTGGTR